MTYALEAVVESPVDVQYFQLQTLTVLFVDKCVTSTISGEPIDDIIFNVDQMSELQVPIPSFIDSVSESVGSFGICGEMQYDLLNEPDFVGLSADLIS